MTTLLVGAILCLVLVPVCLALLHVITTITLASSYANPKPSTFDELYKNKHIDTVLRLMRDAGETTGLMVLRSPKATAGTLQKIEMASNVLCNNGLCRERVNYYLVDDADIVIGRYFTKRNEVVIGWHRGVVRQYDNVSIST